MQPKHDCHSKTMLSFFFCVVPIHLTPTTGVIRYAAINPTARFISKKYQMRPRNETMNRLASVAHIYITVCWTQNDVLVVYHYQQAQRYREDIDDFVRSITIESVQESLDKYLQALGSK